MGPAYVTTPYRDSKIIQTTSMIVILNDDLTWRQIYMDGRKLEKDPNPAWMGYSVAHWDGDTLVLESFGYNDRTWLDFDGHPHSEDLRVIERYRRHDFGQIELGVTFEDPKAFARPWTVAIQMELAPDTEMLEYVCENEKDGTHMASKIAGRPQTETKTDPDILMKYAGIYEIRNGKKRETAAISVSDDSLFWELDDGGKQRLIPSSQTVFSLSGTVIEFVADAQGAMTHFVMQEVEGESQGVRKQ